jgi:Ca2+-transporting ATPase
MNTKINWHTLTADQVSEQLHSDLAAGLNPAEVEERRRRYGPNRLEEKARRGIASMLLGQFADVMIVVLLAAAIISGLLGELYDTLAIMVIVLLNATIGVVQQYRAERALKALKQLAEPTVNVRRGGHPVTVAAQDLVPGDVTLLERGNLVPADIRLSQTASLECDEAALTGESTTISKQTGALAEGDLPVADQINMLFRGTVLTYGRGEGIVVATGMETEIGRIAALLEEGERPLTPLQQRLAKFGARLALIVLGICTVVLVAGLLRGVEPALMFLTAVSLAVAAIPEALPAVVTIALALGARKLIRHNALIRQLPAVETLGSVTVICSDKTGTLTQNQMHVEAFRINDRLHQIDTPAEGISADHLFKALSLNNDAQFDRRGDIIGEPTEVALLQAVLEVGRDPKALRAEHPRLAELPFDSTRKMMTTFHRQAEAIIAYSKGAPEQLLGKCTQELTDAELGDIDPDYVLQQAEDLAADGHRVLAVAYRDWADLPEQISSEAVEKGLVFVGLVALMDPPRPEVLDAVSTCRDAGIRVVMITGDHPVTARAIAHRLGIASEYDRLITGRDVTDLSDTELEDLVAHTPVYARVAPEQKIRIVKALQKRGEFVAMTGDGVNDAPALRRANIGVAMGKVGTDVAREASHMVLLDDNFATIVAAVREGRRIFDNIRKFIRYTMTSNAGEIWTLFLAPFLGLPIPLLPIHILWINLVTDGLPGLALTAEPREPGVMRRPPRPPDEPILSHGMGWQILWIGLLIGGLSITAQAWAIHASNAHWQTMVFTVLTLAQLFNVLGIRSTRQSLFRQGLFSNPPLIGAVLLTVGLQVMVIYVPALQPIFKTAPLSGGELLFCFALSSVVLPAVEFEKWMIRRGWLYGEPAD